MIDKQPKDEPINAKGKFKKRRQVNTRLASTPEMIEREVEQAANSKASETLRKGVV